MTPILGRIHSIQPKACFTTGTRVLTETAPFIIGFYCGNGKPDDIDGFLDPMIDEFIRLSSETHDSMAIRKCTASFFRLFFHFSVKGSKALNSKVTFKV